MGKKDHKNKKKWHKKLNDCRQDRKLEINEFGDDDWPSSYFPPNDFDLPTSEEIEKAKKRGKT